MKTVEIDIDYTSSPAALEEEFRARNLQKGDRLHLISSKIDDTQLIKLAIAIVVLFVIYKRFEEYSDNLLKNVFNNRTTEDIERELKNEYNIELAIDSKEDRELRQWRQFSQSTLVRAYGDAEPEYSEYMVKEPNPDYRK